MSVVRRVRVVLTDGETVLYGRAILPWLMLVLLRTLVLRDVTASDVEYADYRDPVARRVTIPSTSVLVLSLEDDSEHEEDEDGAA